MILFSGKEFKRELQEYIDDKVTSHYHESIQLYDKLSTLKTDFNVAKKSRKDTCKTENGVQLPPSFKESATWNEWLSSKTLNLITVVGQSGAGKSNLAKKILRSQILSSFQYKFYISLDKFDCEKKINVLEFLTQGKLSYGWVVERQIYYNASKKYEKIIKNLHNEKFCIVFDEIGSASFSFDKNAKVSNCYSNELPKHLFSCILNGELFFKAKVVMVLHHWEYQQVMSQLPPGTGKLVHVFGLNHIGQTRMAEGSLCRDERCCAYNVTQKNAAMLNLEAHSEFHYTDKCLLCKNHGLCDCANEIQLLLNVPIHCQSFLKHCSSRIKGCMIANACCVLLKWIEHIFRIYPEKSFSLTKVGEFAWNNYFHNTFLFELAELTNLSKVEKNIFFVSLCDIQGKEKKLIYRFSNILVQDFLAAIWCLSLSNDERKRKKHHFSQWKNSAIVIGFMSEISQRHQEFGLDQTLRVNQENVSKIQRYSSRANERDDPKPRRSSAFLGNQKKTILKEILKKV